jgi:hypothetical protein
MLMTMGGGLDHQDFGEPVVIGGAMSRRSKKRASPKKKRASPAKGARAKSRSRRSPSRRRSPAYMGGGGGAELAATYRVPSPAIGGGVYGRPIIVAPKNW